MVPASGRPRSGERDRADAIVSCSTAVRIRPPASGALARRTSLAPETAWLQVALGNALADQGKWEAAANAYRAAPPGRAFEPRPGVQPRGEPDRRARPRLALGHYRDALELAALSPPAFDVRAVRERVAALEERAEALP